jgi:hypothetical protein
MKILKKVNVDDADLITYVFSKNPLKNSLYIYV